MKWAVAQLIKIALMLCLVAGAVLGGFKAFEYLEANSGADSREELAFMALDPLAEQVIPTAESLRSSELIAGDDATGTYRHSTVVRVWDAPVGPGEAKDAYLKAALAANWIPYAQSCDLEEFTSEIWLAHSESENGRASIKITPVFSFETLKFDSSEVSVEIVRDPEPVELTGNEPSDDLSCLDAHIKTMNASNGPVIPITHAEIRALVPALKVALFEDEIVADETTETWPHQALLYRDGRGDITLSISSALPHQTAELYGVEPHSSFRLDDGRYWLGFPGGTLIVVPDNDQLADADVAIIHDMLLNPREFEPADDADETTEEEGS